MKKLFRQLAKKVHPDCSGIPVNDEIFIKLKNDYEISLKLLDKKIINQIYTVKHLNKNECIHLFLELLAGNFPLGIETRNKNKLYINRISKLNSELNNLLDSSDNLFLQVESEILGLKKNTGMIKQEYSTLRIYFYSYLDYTYSQGLSNQTYLLNEYQNILVILENRKMIKTILFINWLLDGIIRK